MIFFCVNIGNGLGTQKSDFRLPPPGYQTRKVLNPNLSRAFLHFHLKFRPSKSSEMAKIRRGNEEKPCPIIVLKDLKTKVRLFWITIPSLFGINIDIFFFTFRPVLWCFNMFSIICIRYGGSDIEYSS